MKFVEIVDSDDSDADANPFGNGSQGLEAAIYGGGIAERAKDRVRKAKAVATIGVSENVVDDLSDFAEEPKTTSSSARKRKKHSNRIVDSDEEDDLSRDFDQHNVPETIEPETKKSRKKETKTKTKQDKRKALAAYEAPNSETSTVKRPKRGTGGRNVIYTENCDPHGNPLPVALVEPTPDLPTPGQNFTSPDICIITKKAPTEVVKDSELALGSSSIVTQNNVFSPELVKPPSSSSEPMDMPNPVRKIIEDDHDELTAASGSRTVLDSQAQTALPGSTGKKESSLADSTTSDTPRQKNVKKPPKKRGRPKKASVLVSSTETPEVTEVVSGNEMEGSQHDEKPDQTQKTQNSGSTLPEGKHNVFVKNELEVPETPALQDTKATIADVVEKENAQVAEQLPAIKHEPGKVVNYAASGKNPLLTPKLSTGPRYRVGLSRKIRVDSLHQNINRK